MPVAGAFDPALPVFRMRSGTPAGRAWLTALPDMVRRLEAQWGVSTGAPFREGTASWAAPAMLRDGTPAVLKIGWPHREGVGESIGLRLWRGHGAPLLYAAEPANYALLMERCMPGTALVAVPDAVDVALGAAATTLRRLWIAPPEGHGLEQLDAVCAEWAELARERQARLRPPYDPALVALGVGLLTTLTASSSAQLIVHGDANPTNFRSAIREPWLLIDAKPMVGDPSYDVAPLVLQLGSPLARSNPAAVLRRRFERLAELLDQRSDRLIAWSVARSVESALWSASEGDIAGGSAEMAVVAVLAQLLDA